MTEGAIDLEEFVEGCSTFADVLSKAHSKELSLDPENCKLEANEVQVDQKGGDYEIVTATSYSTQMDPLDRSWQGIRKMGSQEIYSFSYDVRNSQE